jgi:hypothetical protein
MNFTVASTCAIAVSISLNKLYSAWASRQKSMQPDEPRAVAAYPSVRPSRRRLLFSNHLSR